MKKNTRHFIIDQVKTDDNAEMLSQLERILSIRKNRQERLESQTREFRRDLEEKQAQVIAQTEHAKAHEQESLHNIQKLRNKNTGKALSVSDILGWQHEEVSIGKEVEKSYERVDELEEEKRASDDRLTLHLEDYKKAVIDAEKIELIRDEMKSAQGDDE